MLKGDTPHHYDFDRALWTCLRCGEEHADPCKCPCCRGRLESQVDYHDPAEPHAAIALAAEIARRDRLKLAAVIAIACPQPHRYVQHRDRRPPWCAACRYTSDGDRIDSEEAPG